MDPMGLGFVVVFGDFLRIKVLVINVIHVDGFLGISV